MNEPNFEQFGRDVWNWIKKQGDDYCGNEDSEDVLPMAQRAGLVRRVIYDPRKHGDIGECEPGDEIWFWGKEVPVAGIPITGPGPSCPCGFAGNTHNIREHRMGCPIWMSQLKKEEET
jgi:hypothetical protein